MSRARYVPRARADIDEISERIAIDNLDAAIRFCHAIEDAAEKLAQFPGMGALREIDDSPFAGLRSWPIKGFRNYLIFYVPTQEGVDILRILHGAREVDAVFSPRDR